MLLTMCQATQHSSVRTHRDGTDCHVTRGISDPKSASLDPILAGVQGIAFGSGPVFAVIAGATPEIVPFPTRFPDGTFRQKVQWMTSRSYTGVVFVSARRLDGSDPILFDHGTLTASMRWIVPGANGQFEPGAVVISVPGCYEWNVTGTTFNESIIFQASIPAA